MSKSPNKSLDYLEVYIRTHLETVIFLWCGVYICSTMTGLDIFNLHHSASKPVWNGRRDVVLSPHPGFFFFF